ncbi:hypothetical protein XELAEV_18039793mg [Xenopus laevis]|uniref:Uncharacterized protein n=1 Tax=Xenopus laevis TaxID=8355 RepID=A0A974H8P0_XENLA|nr:hypothetical protein XELAEV_18039793mg [Xenopus laevis]
MKEHVVFFCTVMYSCMCIVYTVWVIKQCPGKKHVSSILLGLPRCPSSDLDLHISSKTILYSTAKAQTKSLLGMSRKSKWCCFTF